MKKLLLLLAIVAVALTTNATNYYISAAGNDAAAGTSPATAWKTLSKANSFTYAANDSILLKRGDVFFGALTANRNNLNYGAYGTGARPLISGFVTLTGWTLVSPGIYKASVAAKSYLNMVTLNGRPQQIGRYPNAGGVNGGFLPYEAATTTSVTDNEMTSAVNWTGAEIVIRKNGWKIDRCIITNHSGTTFTYRTGRSANNGGGPGGSSAAKLGHGYFIQDDIRTLDQVGEWYYDTTARMMNMYFGTNTPGNYVVQVSAIDTLLNANSRTYISVSDINFEGANISGIYSYFAGNITVKNCDFTNIGSRAIHFYGTGNVLIDNVKVFNCLSNSMQVICNTKTNVTIKNSLIRNNGQIPGMGSYFDDSDYKGIYMGVSSTALIENNVLDTIGAAGIQFNGSDILVQKNYVNYFCNVTHDNGGIYTFVAGTDAAPGALYVNRTIRNNVVSNGISAPNGTNSTSPFVAGIYLDGRSMNVNILDNVVFNSAKNGVHCNNPSYVTIRGNTFFNNLQDISFMRYAWGSINNFNVKQNISFPYTTAQRNIYYVNGGLNTPVATDLQATLRSMGSIDSNYYNTYNDGGIQMEVYDSEGGAVVPTSPFSLDGWKAFTGHDRATKKPAPKILPYTITSTIGANLFTNSQFNTNITGVTLFGSSTTAAWDNTSKITGSGSIRINFAAPVANRFSLLHSPVGAVSNTKKYVLRFKTLGTTANGVVRGYIRKTASPYNNLVPTQTKTFGLAKTTQEFLFESPIADAGASLVIEIDQNSGTTYIDDIEFYEVTATVNTIESQVRFVYNETGVVKTVTLGGKYAGVDSTIYNGSLVLQPFSAKVLIKVGVTDTLPIANAGADINVFLPADSALLKGTATGSPATGYTWTKISGPAQYLLTNAASATAKVSNLVVGTYRFELRVIDNAGHTGRDTLSVNVSTILPVKLTSFNGTRNGDKVDLKWATESEVNASHYKIQRSADGNKFETIGQVAAHNTPGQNSYIFTDHAPIRGKNYYRLEMVDIDASAMYSRTILVNMSGRQPFTVDNAAVTGTQLRLTVSAERRQTLNIMAVDVAGRLMMRRQVTLQPGINTITQEMILISKAVYYIRMFTDEENVVRTVLSE